MQIYAVVGRFDENGGKRSSYAHRLVSEFVSHFAGVHVEGFNGGSITDFYSAYDRISLLQPDVIIWFPDVPNDELKLVPGIKHIHPHCILVSSKNNSKDQCSFHQLVNRALVSKSNLLVEFRQIDGKWAATILDPLGNIFLNRETDIDTVRTALFYRIKALHGCTRVSSKRELDAEVTVPDNPEFFALAREYAAVFHELIHGAHPERFMGNLSFRCENGFPSYKAHDVVFVSRRNVDKQGIGRDDFVGVDPSSLDQVKYYGPNKPSVDTPIQLRLYDYYRNIRYMLHSHAYIDGALFTKDCVPCGAIEEFGQIVATNPNPDSKAFQVNLRGHGSIAFGCTVADMAGLSYVARSVPEIQETKDV